MLKAGTPVVPLVTDVLGAADTPIGRIVSRGFEIHDPEVSQRHASLLLSSHTLRIRDCSRHGTIVLKNDGERVQLSATRSETVLHDGDVIVLGGSMLVVRRDALQPRASSDDSAKGAGLAWLEALHAAEQVASGPHPVLIEGETGSGKEVVADYIHRKSGRSGKFIKLNCAAIPESLAERELFGHVKGSFTGANSDSPGSFGAAHGGTLFLDEIGDLPLSIQAKLLRVVQDGKIPVVGVPEARARDVRIIAATHKNLAVEVSAGRFRKDLHFRFARRIALPALRQRAEDVFLLADGFYRKTPKAADSSTELEFDIRLAVELVRFGWAGNVRELQSTVEALALNDPPFTCDHAARTPLQLAAHRGVLTAVGLERAEQLIAENKKQRQIERLLGISRRTLIRKLDEAGKPHPWKKSKK